MQKQINKLLIALVAAVLLSAAGGCTNNSSTNNAAVNNTTQNINSNSNLSNKNDSNESLSENMLGGCSSVDQTKLEKNIVDKLSSLKYQFKKFNPLTGTADLAYNPSTQVLTFKGSLQSDANDLADFFKEFDKFRTKKCVRKVSFEGKTPAENFEWSFTSNPSPNASDVRNIIDNGKLKDQINKNFFYSLPDGSTVLTLTGIIDDVPGKGLFKGFSEDLGDAISNGNITKIVFGKSNKTSQDNKLMDDFYWAICDGGQVECNGECRPPELCIRENTNNDNVNRNTSMNANTDSNANH